MAKMIPNMQVDNLKQMLNHTKDAALNKVLLAIISVMAFGLIVSLTRIAYTGFVFHYFVHIVMAAILLVIYVFRNKVPTQAKGIIFLCILFTMAVSGLFTFGLYSFAYAYFIPATAISFLYFNRRIGWYFAIFCLVIILIAEYQFRVGKLHFIPDIGYMQTKVMWFNMIMTITLVSIAMTMFWNNMNSMLTGTFVQVIDQQNKLKKLNVDLIVARDKAEESDRLKTSFLRNISHEIRTPLNIIIGFSSIISDTKDPNTISKYNKAIWENSDNVLKIINDIVVFSEIETQTFKICKKDFNIKEILHDLEKNFKNKAVENSIDFIFEAIEIDIYSDMDRIELVLTNLLDNAFKFTKAGEIKFCIKEQDESISFIISDTGIGISKGDLESIFNKFYKADTFSIGAGLGLSISKSIANLLDGYIHVQSESGKGSTFVFSVPMKFRN